MRIFFEFGWSQTLTESCIVLSQLMKAEYLHRENVEDSLNIEQGACYTCFKHLHYIINLSSNVT